MKIASRFAGSFRSLPFALLAASLAFSIPASRLSAGSQGVGQSKPAFSAVTVIGDSLSDTGRAAQVLGPLFPPFYYQGRVSNGPVWIEYFSAKLGLAYDPLENFAWAGSRTGYGNSLTPLLPGMRQQADELLSLAKHVDKNALYVVFGGSNDFARILQDGESPQVVIPQAVANIITMVSQLRAAGAKHIVVVDVPNLGLTPRVRAGGPTAQFVATALSLQYNALLNLALDAMDKKIIRVSAFEITTMLAANPAAFGFTNVQDMGYLLFPGGDTYLFWDDFHPTTRAHAYVADAIYQAVEAAGLLKKTAAPLAN